MEDVRNKFERIAYTGVPVLIRGEAGTGKETLARLIHRSYPGETAPFHKVSPAGRAGWRRSESLLATPEQACKTPGSAPSGGTAPARTVCIGTLFFDEVAELNSSSQQDLAHLLLDDWPQGMGPSEFAPPLFRIICSTSHDIEREMTCGRFREDLFYSVNIVSLDLLPLRERREDIPCLVRYFWARYREEFRSDTPEPASSFLDVLQAYSWPGNIRELAAVTNRYVLLGSHGTIVRELTANPSAQPARNPCPAPSVSLKSLARQKVRKLERKIIFKTLREKEWNRKRAARALNISYRALLYKIKEAGVPPNRIVVKREK